MRFFENIIRVGVIETTDFVNQTCSIRMFDRVDTEPIIAALPQPSPGNDAGFYVNPERDTVVAVGWSYRERPVILAILPSNSFSADLTEVGNTFDVPVGSTGFPTLQNGEIAMGGKNGTEIKLTKCGDITTRFGESFLNLSKTNRFVSKTRENIISTEGKFSTSGVILRDTREKLPDAEELNDKMTNLNYLTKLTPIARDPANSPVKLTSASVDKTDYSQRNPPFIENKRIVYEFAQSYMHGTLDEEGIRLKGADTNFLFRPSRRDRARYDILNLNQDFPNNLIESVEGTLVDINGKILDLNRRVIEFPENIDGVNSDWRRLDELATLTRRSIKLHYEINSRKHYSGGIITDDLKASFTEIPNGHNHSRWSVDVDGEGLTKINIPASSNSGNIPLLSRYITDNLRKDAQDIEADNLQGKANTIKHKDISREKDIHHLAFGDFTGEGVPIVSSYIPENIGTEGGAFKYRTAFHDITTTANELLSSTAISTAILDNHISGNGNVGGRSIAVNLDGSIELNIGRDYIDNKSMVVDMSGGIVSRIGKMKDSSDNASIISQLDGSVLVQVGGDSVGDDAKNNTPTVKLLVKGSGGTDEIIIDENMIKIKTANGSDGGKLLMLESTGDLVIKAGRTLFLTGSEIVMLGDVKEDNGKVVLTGSGTRKVMSNGKEI